MRTIHTTFLRLRACSSILLGGILLSAWAAGPPAVPAAEVNLGLLNTIEYCPQIVIGAIVRIDSTNAPVTNSLGQRDWGVATIEVAETLKGEPVKTINFHVGDAADSRFLKESQTGPLNPKPANQVGDSGIWMFLRGESGPIQLWPLSYRAEVVQTLDRIAHRQWTAPVNGLAAWGDSNFVLAVKNFSTSNIFLPDGRTSTFVRLSVQDTNGSVSHWRLVVDNPGVLDTSRRAFSESDTNACIVRNFQGQPETLRCINLGPGDTVHLCGRETLLVALRNSLPPGHYTVTVGCQNSIGSAVGWNAAGKNIPVTAWAGELKAVTIPVDVPPLDPRKKASLENHWKMQEEQMQRFSNEWSRNQQLQSNVFNAIIRPQSK